jgi:glycosyltransferase involved in cell wall biosynthesis
MKKILFFVPTFSNLSETFILREINALDLRSNIDVHVISLKEGKASLPENLKYKVSYIPINFSEIFLSIPFIIKNFWQILKVGLKFFKMSDDSFSRNLKNFLKSLIYASKISIFKFDQLHIHFLSDISTIIGLASIILKKPFSISGHARDIFIDGSAIDFKVKNSKFITLCNTKAFLKCLELSGGKGRKNVVLGFHGIDNNDYEFKIREFKATSTLEVLTDGRFTPKKGLIPLSEAVVSLIKDYGFKINFTIIGLAIGESQKEILENVKKLFKDAHLYEHLHIPGNGNGIQQNDVKEYYKKSDIFIYAGIDAVGGDSDGVPNGLLQAAFSGIPIITTTAGSISDLFDSENSYIINQNSPESIIEKFNELILDKNLKRKTTFLHSKAVENFGIEKNIKYLEDLLLK